MTSHDSLGVKPTTRAASPLESLSVVMPVYNEGEHVLRALAALRRAAAVAEVRLHVVLVDDGSDDPASVAVLDGVADDPDVMLLRQPNQGRFKARAAGLARVRDAHVLLLDARVEVDERSLSRIGEAVADGAEVWNFDVTPASQSWGAAFWTGITKVWWRDYFRHRRTVRFGVEDFDRYPKGTGAFFAPTQVLRDAVGGFSSFFAQADLASDDTRLLREVAAARGISLSPEITCRHRAKSGGTAWARQCYYRGTTFVDGYLTDPRRAGAYLAAGTGAVAAGAVLLARRPAVALGTVGAVSAAAGGVTHHSGGTVKESLAVTTLTPAFAGLFGAGVLRGLGLALPRRGR